ncbi:hypothetical protein R5R35_013616 [Gryllus longicercus]|uniref:G-protein coupled receptors family 1 profile domain-containing protein n=1 Tax=Gryllus longicercus TaxID=2509291 RepID=A0AAN9VQ44_9ORTH
MYGPVVLQCSGGAGLGARCFATSSAPRRSNESQCPMLQQPPPPPAARGGARSLRLSPVSPRAAGPAQPAAAASGAGAGSVTQHKKLRFALARERKASTTLGIIMSAFIICWLPFFVLALVRPFVNGVPDALSSFFLWLGYANSLLNPVIYATLNRDFRKPFQQILYFRCGSLNHMMREEFYHSQYGDPDNQYYVINTSQHTGAPRSPTCYREDSGGGAVAAAVAEAAAAGAGLGVGLGVEDDEREDSPPPGDPATERGADESFL